MARGKPRKHKKADRTPKLWAPDGTRLLCSECRMRATYPDRKCCEHTSWLQGDRLQRRHVDNDRFDNGKTRRNAWDLHRAQCLELNLPWQ